MIFTCSHASVDKILWTQRGRDACFTLCCTHLKELCACVVCTRAGGLYTPPASWSPASDSCDSVEHTVESVLTHWTVAGGLVITRV